MSIAENRAAVVFKDVSYRRGSGSHETSILKDIQLTIDTGEWVCIVGENGSGKSTLVRMINGMLSVSNGEIHVAGKQLNPDTLWDIRQRVGIVFANPDDQFVGMTVADDIAFGLENQCLDHVRMQEKIADYAQKLQITHLLDRHPATLSGGQKQRCAIAAVLAMEPSIVIFDEAASMLDERSKIELLDTMKAMRQSGNYTLISVTHDTDEMAAADRMIVLADQTIAADGKPQDILKRDDLMQRCRLLTPYPLQLCRELKLRGIDIGEYIDEREVLAALWEYHSKTCPTDIKMKM